MENISFIRITFAYSDWNLVAIGDSRGQATLQGPTAVIAMGNQNWHFDVYRAFDVPGAAIEVENSRSIVFERNTIKHTGNIGLALKNDVCDSQIIGNQILDTAGSAIVIGHPQHVYEGDGLEIKHPFGVGIDKRSIRQVLRVFPGIMKSVITILTVRGTVPWPECNHGLLCGRSADHP